MINTMSTDSRACSRTRTVPARTAAADDDRARPQRKKEMHALQAARRAAGHALSRDQLERIDLPEELREAVDFARGVTSHEGRRRHMQYLGKLMRRVDGDAIRAALERVTGESRAAVSLMHQAERWRDRLLDDDAALTDSSPIIPRPMRNGCARRSAPRAVSTDAQQAPKHARELYRWLHAHLDPALEPRASDAGQ